MPLNPKYFFNLLLTRNILFIYYIIIILLFYVPVATTAVNPAGTLILLCWQGNEYPLQPPVPMITIVEPEVKGAKEK
jgi:hypothetical protein